MDNTSRIEKKYLIMAVLEVITGLAICIFWICFFVMDLVPANPPEGYLAYELAFPLPDIILSISMFIAAYLLFKDKKTGKNLSLANGGALIFLGVVDFSFNYQNGIYTGPIAETAGNIWMNFEVTAVGVYILFCLLRK